MLIPVADAYSSASLFHKETTLIYTASVTLVVVLGREFIIWRNRHLELGQYTQSRDLMLAQSSMAFSDKA